MENIKETILGTDIIIVDGKKVMINDLLIKFLPKIKYMVNYLRNIPADIKEEYIQELCIKFIIISKKYKDNIGAKFDTFMIGCLKNSLTTYLQKHNLYIKRTESYEELIETGEFEYINITNKDKENENDDAFNNYCNNNKDGDLARLKYSDKYTLEEISDKIGISKQAISIKLNKFNEGYKKNSLKYKLEL